MAEKVVGIFDTEAEVIKTEQDLARAGVPARLMRRYHRGQPLPGDLQQPGISRTETKTGGFFAWLFDEQPTAAHEHEDLYQRHVDAGRFILSVETSSHAPFREITDIMQTHHPIDVTSQTVHGETVTDRMVDTNTGPLDVHEAMRREPVPDQASIAPTTAASVRPDVVEGETVIPLAA